MAFSLLQVDNICCIRYADVFLQKILCTLPTKMGTQTSIKPQTFEFEHSEL